MTSFYSNGKLLLTGEYLVLSGAQALAVPLNIGQSMKIKEKDNDSEELEWIASDINGVWFEAKISLKNFEIIESTDQKRASYLSYCLKVASCMNPSFLLDKKSIVVENYCSFDINWGLGSSSTFLSNLAWWADVDPFLLHQSVSKGSGYDIACARSSTPIIYTIQNGSPAIIETTFNPPFANNLFLGYSGKKQDSAESVLNYKSIFRSNALLVEKISKLTFAISEASNIDDFMQLMVEHEQIISKLIAQVPVKKRTFSDFEGEVKTLGAWGGDFFLAASKESGNYVSNYFSQKGLATIIPFGSLIL